MIALFDFDGTITNNDTFIGFAKYCVGTRRFYLSVLRNIFPILAMKAGIYPSEKAKEKLFKFCFLGYTLDKFESKAEEFAELEFSRIVKSNAIETIKDLQNKGATVFIVSASIENWINPFAQKLGIPRENVLATKIEIDPSNRLTGKFSSKNCKGQEKVNRIMERIPEWNTQYFIAFGDSGGDKEMLKFANKSYYRVF